MNLIEFDAVEKRYGRTVALAGADLAVPRGSTMGLVGPNGAGKTTSMLIMTSLLERDGGRVRVGGLDPERDPKAVRRNVGYMPDFFGVYEGLRTREYLDFFCAVQKIRPAARPAVIADLLALVGLESKADADVNTLSRGMKQRLSLARALIHDPELLVLDEPASGLDPRARVELRELIAELQRMGRTIVISSHILSELEGICSHLAFIDHGKVLAQGTIEEIRERIRRHSKATVRVPLTDLERAEALLAQSAAVEGVSVERDRLVALFSGDDMESATLLASLVGAGIRVIEWRVDRPGIEELFLAATDDTASAPAVAEPAAADAGGEA